MMRSDKSRAIKNLIFTVLCCFCLIIVTVFLLSILFALIKNGLPYINGQIFTQITPSPGDSHGGLLNAIVGTLIMNFIAIVLATPIGIAVAVYLVEISRKSSLQKFVRFCNDILLSMPSIIAGLFIYAIIVKPLGHYSAWAGAIALMIIAIPMIVRATEDVLYLVSPLMRESAVALGIPRWRVTFVIIFRSVKQGLITAVLLALARIMGETAPLLFTSLSSNYLNLNLGQPMANLPIIIYQYAMSPYRNWQHLAWAGALMITVFVLVVNLLSRLISKESKKGGL